MNLTLYRAYNPAIGRWLSRDPIDSDTDPIANLYLYASDDPIGAVDLLGLTSESFPNAEKAAQAGAYTDIIKASGGKKLHGLDQAHAPHEYAGYVCRCKCSTPQKPCFYYTGPTEGHGPGYAPNGKYYDRTYTWTPDLTPCNSKKNTVGLHYGHPDGTAIPPEDVFAEGPIPTELAIPLDAKIISIRYLHTGGPWPRY